jgi:hypothetical protein
MYTHDHVLYKETLILRVLLFGTSFHFGDAYSLVHRNL